METVFDLKDTDFAEKDLNENFRSGTIVLLGPANAGKSTLLNTLVGSKVSIVSPKKQTTRNRVLGVKTIENGQLVFIDTPGFMAKRYRGELARFLNRSLVDSLSEVDIVALVLDSLTILSNQRWFESLRSALKQKINGAINLVILNKDDLLESAQVISCLQNVYERFSKWAQEEQRIPPEVVHVSALKNSGIDELTKTLLKMLPLGQACFPLDYLSDQPEEFLASEIIREKLTVLLREELPYCCAVRIEGWEEEKDLLKINAVILVERDSQKPIVIGRKGLTLKSVGKYARVELEKIFNVKVFLKLFVKVETNWTRTKRGLIRAGYL